MAHTLDRPADTQAQSPLWWAAIRAVLCAGLSGCTSGQAVDDAALGYLPEVAILSVTEGQVLYPGQTGWEFVGSVTDRDEARSTDLEVYFAVFRGEEIINAVYPTPDANGNVVVSASRLEEGSYQLVLEAIDSTGGRAEASVDFEVLNLAPVVSILSPAGSATVDQGDSLSLEALVTDADNPPDEGFQVRIEIDDEVVETLQIGPSGSIITSIPLEEAGSFILGVVALDEFSRMGVDSIPLEVRSCTDDDGDGYWTCTSQSPQKDCNDANPDVAPGLPEACDRLDTNCDGTIPANEFDLDGDGFTGCEGDCLDSDPAISPAAQEQCNGQDDDCDGTVPSNEFDLDTDGYLGCASGDDPVDCNDGAATAYPGAPEMCDGLDNNCDGRTLTEEADRDEDGVMVCEMDCDDDDAYTYPGAVERLDFKDNNCDGLLEGAVSLSAANAILAGPQAEAQAGLALSAGGDINQDSIGDLAVGAPRYNAPGGSGNLRGGVLVYFGRQGDWSNGSGPDPQSSLLLSESEPAAQAGAAVSLTPDITGDGIGDLLVGIPGHSTSSVVEAGGVYLIEGRTTWQTEPLIDLALTVVEGSNDAMNLGTSLSGPFDINGDGAIDVAIGAPWTERRPTSPGLVAVISNRLLGWGTRTSVNSLARINGADNSAIGVSLAVGQTTGDGFDDLIVGGLEDPDTSQGLAYWIPGSASIRQGFQTSVTALGAQYYDGDTGSERIGNTVASGSDVNGDGLDDLLVGRYLDGDPSDAAAYLLFGTPVLPTSGNLEELASVRFGRAEGDNCPCSVVSLPDWNGDGLGDFAISAARADTFAADTGRVYLFLGREVNDPWPDFLDLSEADGVLLGEASSDSAGWVLSPGDLNRDGLSDLVISAPYASTRSSSGSTVPRAGKVYVVLGSRS